MAPKLTHAKERKAKKAVEQSGRIHVISKIPKQTNIKPKKSIILFMGLTIIFAI